MTTRDALVVHVSRVLGRDRIEPIDHRITSFTFEDDEQKLDHASITVDNFDLSNFDDPTWAHGNVFRITWGYAGNVAPSRDMVVKKVTGGRSLTVELKDLAVVMDSVRHAQTYEEMTRSEVVRMIAEKNGYTGAGLHVEDTTERFETIVQSNMTDAQMLRKLAHKEGFEFFVDFDGLHWHRRNVDQAPLRTITYYTSQTGDVIDFNIENDITRKPGRVRVKSRDPLTRKDITAVADDGSDKNRVILQDTIAVIDPETDSLIEIPTLRVAASPTDADANVAQDTTRHSNASSQAEADAEAKGRFRKLQQVAVRMTLELVGDPSLVAKSVVELTGFGRRLSGKYYIRKIKHSLSGSGYTCSLTLITDGYGRGQRGAGAHPTAGDGNAALLAALGRLTAIYPTESAAIGSGVDLIRRIVDEMYDRVPAASTPNDYRSMANRMREVVGLCTRTGALATAQAAAEFIAIAVQLSKGERIAQGKPNEKPAKESTSELVEVGRIDPETGTVITTFEDHGGRD